jgi:hypothetical protein
MNRREFITLLGGARLADLGGTVLPGSPAAFGKLIAEETDVIRALNIKAE